MQLTDVLIGLGPYVVYYPRLCPILGGVNATIMLCHLIGWTGSQRDPDGWIYKTQAELERETGLSRREQDTARARLLDLGMIEVKRKGVPPVLHYRPVLAAVNAAWETDCTKAPDRMHAGTEAPERLHESARSNARKRQGSTPTATPTNDGGPGPTLAERMLAADRPDAVPPRPIRSGD